MKTDDQVSNVLDQVKKHLDTAAEENIRLNVDGHKLDDEWLYIVLTPSQPGMRASDHAELMAKIEKQLRKDGFDKVLLVPAIED